MNWLLKRLREPSTWRGLVWLATVTGLSLRPDQAEAIVAAGMALAGLLGVFLSDESKPVRVEVPPIALQGRPESGDAALGVGAVRPADGLRVPAQYRSGPAQAAARTPSLSEPPAVGWGDRD